MSENLVWLQNWYKSQCDGDWEHEYGVKIGTLDNPGWSIKIDLIYTEIEGIEVENRLIEKSEEDWYAYSIKENLFSGFGDPEKLDQLIAEFRQIVETGKK